MPATRVSMDRCRIWLAAIWFVGSGFIFLVVLLQVFLGHYGERINEAFGWFFPTVTPTLSLIISVLVVERRQRTRVASRFLFILSLTLSSVYLLIVSLTILLQPFASIPPLELMQKSNIWLGPFQTLVVASVGAFFSKIEQI